MEPRSHTSKLLESQNEEVIPSFDMSQVVVSHIDLVNQRLALGSKPGTVTNIKQQCKAAIVSIIFHSHFSLGHGTSLHQMSLFKASFVTKHYSTKRLKLNTNTSNLRKSKMHKSAGKTEIIEG